MNNFSKLCIHTITTKPWTIEEALDQYCKRNIGGISIWQDAVEGKDLQKIQERIRQYPIEVVSYVRGGFFPHPSETGRSAAIDKNKKMIEEAATLGSPMLVLVCGAEPTQSLAVSRDQIKAGIEAILPLAEALNIKLGIEPLHPMYADTRSAINTMAQANDAASYFASPFVGVAVDVYHLWWDPDLEKEIMRCGEMGKLFAYHICDWKVPTEDMLLDREIMGKGCIPINDITSWVEKAGFDAYKEVEIFSNKYWAMDQEVYLDEILKAF